MIPAKMKAAALDRFGGPEVIGIKTVPVPRCDDDEILIRVEAAGVAVWDPVEREGGMAGLFGRKPKFPYVPGSDGAGEVVAVGKGVGRFQVGDRVYAAGFGNPKGGFYAEYAAVPETQAAKIPKGMPVEEAAALASDGITGLDGLEHLALRKGDRLLVFGASGGIGHMAVQLAKRLGAVVLAIASGEDGVQLARKLGADVVAEGHRREDVEKACREFRPEKALVLAGGEVCNAALALIAEHGRVAYPHGVEPEPVAPKGLEVIGYDGDPSQESFERLNQLIEAGPFHLEIGRMYALEQAAQAQQDVLKHHLGKFALKIH